MLAGGGFKFNSGVGRILFCFVQWLSLVIVEGSSLQQRKSLLRPKKKLKVTPKYLLN